MEPDDLTTLRRGIREMLKETNEYTILDLIYQILLQSTRSSIDSTFTK